MWKPVGPRVRSTSESEDIGSCDDSMFFGLPTGKRLMAIATRSEISEGPCLIMKSNRSRRKAQAMW